MYFELGQRVDIEKTFSYIKFNSDEWLKPHELYGLGHSRQLEDEIKE